LPEAIGGQLLVLTPWMVWQVLQAWRAADAGVDRRLARLSWPVLAAWLGLSCVVRVEANWPAIAWLPALVLVLRRPAPTMGRAAWWAGGLTAVAAVGVLGLARWLPPGQGPPRDGPRLAACLDQQLPGATLVTGRYQEQALLWSAARPAAHRRAAGHRSSWYDRLAPAPLLCGYHFIGRASGLDHCVGTRHESAACGRWITECRCVGDRRPAGRL
jgi:hypothetical protein